MSLRVEVLSDAVNNVVVRTGDRRYPALVVQGDRLKEWGRLASAADGRSVELLASELATLSLGTTKYALLMAWRWITDRGMSGRMTERGSPQVCDDPGRPLPGGLLMRCRPAAVFSGWAVH
jgi:hypothetical protein